MSDAAASIADPLNAVLRLRPGLSITPRQFGGQVGFVIEDRFRAKFFRIGVDEYALVSLLDGTRTVQAAIAAAAVRLQQRAFSESEALAICHWLLESQIVENALSANTPNPLPDGLPTARSNGWNNPLCIRLPLFNPTSLLKAIAPWLQWTFSKPFFAFWCACCLYGLSIAVENCDQLFADTAVVFNPRQWWLLALCWLVLKLLHETYHGLVCRQYGGAVREAGIFLILFAPVPYVDLTDSWRFESTWRRIATAAAGMYVELFVAAAGLVLWAHSNNGETKHFAVSVATMAGIGAIVINANPLMRFDGYFILSDLLGIPNLNAQSRRWLVSLVARTIGVTAVQRPLPAQQKYAIAVYAIVSLAWRILVYGGLAIAAMVLAGRVQKWLSLALAVLLLVGLAYRAFRGLAALIEQQPIKPVGRLAAVSALAFALLALAACFLGGSATIRVPGIVDYKPLVIVRADSPGFVRRLLVKDGDQVESGQLLAVLENRELKTEVAIARLELEKSIAECRVLRQAGEVAKEQGKLATQAALRKKVAELSRQAESLIVRAPVAGTLINRDLPSWLDRYVETGTAIFSIGDEQSKEVVVAIPQNDVDLFLEHSKSSVRIWFNSVGAPPIESNLDSIEQRATTVPPQVALSSQNGGPLAVKLTEENTPSKPKTEVLLDPCFKASIPLTHDQSRRLRAGQLATILLTSPEQSPLRRLQLLIERWYSERLRS
jgi:putative peptide zinc metalloprotease protein